MAAALQLHVLDAELVLHLIARVEPRGVGEVDPQTQLHLTAGDRELFVMVRGRFDTVFWAVISGILNPERPSNGSESR